MYVVLHVRVCVCMSVIIELNKMLVILTNTYESFIIVIRKEAIEIKSWKKNSKKLR